VAVVCVATAGLHLSRLGVAHVVRVVGGVPFLMCTEACLCTRTILAGGLPRRATPTLIERLRGEGNLINVDDSLGVECGGLVSLIVMGLGLTVPGL
jgi:hypothetical protein